MAANLAEIEARLWDVADNLRANSGLASHEYSTPVLGIIFLRPTCNLLPKLIASETALLDSNSASRAHES